MQSLQQASPIADRIPTIPTDLSDLSSSWTRRKPVPAEL